MHNFNNKDTKELLKAFLAVKTTAEAEKFLGDLLTPAEVAEFSNRWKVARMLDAKVSYEEIARVSGMSSTTIARISKWLQKGMGGYRLILDRLKNK
ncbi:MAG TPA: YerC/YecD family TrpR-related protein [Candidatus Saccharimonadales bacterium]|nr:YerC/YecD family TrpR-related protein [Candidatus Saccharimonadales bacterium]